MAFEPCPAERNFVEVWLLMIVTTSGPIPFEEPRVAYKTLVECNAVKAFVLRVIPPPEDVELNCLGEP